MFMSSLIRWRPQFPWRPLESLWEREFEEIWEDLEDMMEPFWMEPEEISRWKPRLETYHKDGNYVIKADVPGVDPKDVQVTLEGDRLIIQGERRMDREVKERDFRRREVSYGSFRRTVPIPQGLKTEEIKAKYRDGVLEISAPMDQRYLPKKIEVEVPKD